MTRALHIVLLVPLLTHAALGPGAPVDQNGSIQIGTIDYFGYTGVDLKLVQARIPVKAGDRVSIESFDHDRAAIQRAVKEVTGKPATDVAAVCCDGDRRLLIYIGLDGASSHSLVPNRAPEGNDHLDGSALKLYERDGEAIQNAVRRGVAGEDDSRGYSLSADPAAREVQLSIRTYATSHVSLLERVLENSASAEDRRASACFLGYADRSADQIQRLTHAANDRDDEVRNNAIRALEVLASVKDFNGVDVDPTPFIDLLFSGRWTDRNKSSMLLMQLTKNRDPAVLEALRKHAIAPLIEGARWNNPGHSTAFLLILGRVDGIPEDGLGKMIADGDKLPIIRPAEQELSEMHSRR